jgi:hypothetical protein
MQAERRQLDRRQSGDRRSTPSEAWPEAPPHTEIEEAPPRAVARRAVAPRAESVRLCRSCGSSLLDRSRRGPIERIVTTLIGRAAYRCRLCRWRGWLRAD